MANENELAQGKKVAFATIWRENGVDGVKDHQRFRDRSTTGPTGFFLFVVGEGPVLGRG